MWLTSVTVWPFCREGVAKSPCRCGSVFEIYTFLAALLQERVYHINPAVTPLSENTAPIKPKPSHRLKRNLHTVRPNIADESEYVRKSIGNALKDISKKYPELVSNELKQWDLSSKEIKQVHKLASAYLNKS